MALKKPAFEKEPAAEDQGNTAVATPEVASTVAQQQPDAAAKVSATTAIAAASGRAIASTEAMQAAKQFNREVEAMQGGADFSYGAHRVFKGIQGSIQETKGEKMKLGRWVKVQLLAWDRHFEISPGSQSDESSPYVAYSKDGEIVDSVVGEDMKSWEGKPVADYVHELRANHDFENASKREFIDTQCAVIASEDAPDFREIIQITLSSSSLPAFKAYQSQIKGRARCAVMNIPGYPLPDNPFQFYFVREDAQKGKNSWTKLKICLDLPAKI